MDVAGKLVSAACALLETLDGQEDLQNCGLNQVTKKQVTDIWESVYGGWNS